MGLSEIFTVNKILVMLAAYFAGSISFASIIAKLNKVDLSKVGSGNPGATNVSRALGKRWGYLCFLLDVSKGFAPTFFAGIMIKNSDAGSIPTSSDQIFWLIVAACCILGHCFSIWLRFKGGKGVATSLGVVLGIFPYFTLPGLTAFAVWILTVLITRYVSLASIIAGLAFLPAFFAINSYKIGLDKVTELKPLIVFASIMIALVIFRHISNIKRLIKGTENKIGSKKS